MNLKQFMDCVSYMNDKEDKIETVMKADLRSCISTASDRAQLIIGKKKHQFHPLQSRGQQRKAGILSECEHAAHSSAEDAIKCRLSQVTTHPAPSSELRAVMLRYRTEIILFPKINTLMYLHVDTQEAFVVFLFSAFLTSFVNSKLAEFVFSSRF